ncbi:MAG: hypothetical protein KDD53_07575 [Bdellovibrionales bacterium]|nr:hypothetical protein [Bdellovibrionales bacterium]
MTLGKPNALAIEEIEGQSPAVHQETKAETSDPGTSPLSLSFSLADLTKRDDAGISLDTPPNTRGGKTSQLNSFNEFDGTIPETIDEVLDLLNNSAPVPELTLEESPLTSSAEIDFPEIDVVTNQVDITHPDAWRSLWVNDGLAIDPNRVGSGMDVTFMDRPLADDMENAAIENRGPANYGMFQRVIGDPQEADPFVSRIDWAFFSDPRSAGSRGFGLSTSFDPSENPLYEAGALVRYRTSIAMIRGAAREHLLLQELSGNKLPLTPLMNAGSKSEMWSN